MDKWFAYSLSGTKLLDQPDNGFESRADALAWAISGGYKKFTVQKEA